MLNHSYLRCVEDDTLRNASSVIVSEACVKVVQSCLVSLMQQRGAGTQQLPDKLKTASALSQLSPASSVVPIQGSEAHTAASSALDENWMVDILLDGACII